MSARRLAKLLLLALISPVMDAMAAADLPENLRPLAVALTAAHQHLQSLNASVQQGGLNEAQAKEQGRAFLRAYRLQVAEGDNYLFAFDTKLRLVVHPIRPELEGRDFSGVLDPTGKPIFTSFLTASQGVEVGSSEYFWPKPGCATPMRKVGVVKVFDPWGWVIATSIYVNEGCTETP